MSVTPSMFALDTRNSWVPSRLRRRRPTMRLEPSDAPIPRRVVYPALVAVSVLLWIAIAELVLLLVRSSLFS